MINILLTIVCSTSIALLLKHNAEKGGEPVVLLAGNYLVAAFISFGLIVFEDKMVFVPQTFVFGILLAALFVFAFFAFARSVAAAGTSLSTLSSRLSVIVPLVLSMILFAESPSIPQAGGIVLALGTILLFYFSLSRNKHLQLGFMDYFYLIAVLIGIGINDFCMKIFQHWRPPGEKPFFLFTIFFFAFIYSALYLIKFRIVIDRGTAIRGIVLGVPNMLSSFFLISALAAVPAIVVYPVVNIGIILLTTFGAMALWKEKLNIYGIAALVCGGIAIILLGI